MDDDTKDLIDKLLDYIPENRIGMRNGIEEIMEHPYFSDINFCKLAQRNYKVPCQEIITSCATL